MLGATTTTTISDVEITLGETGRIIGESVTLAENTHFQIAPNATLEASLNNASGFFDTGVQAGQIEITGDYTQEQGGTTRIAVGGLSPATEYDQITVGGTTNLSGLLQVDIANSFIPAFGTALQILDSVGEIDGVYSDIRGLGVVPWRAEYSSNQITLIAQHQGDFDADQDVDEDDFAIWQQNHGLGSNATHLLGDANGDGAVDGQDFLLWQRDFGSSYPLASATATVPEPATMVYATLIMIVASWRRTQPAYFTTYGTPTTRI